MKARPAKQSGSVTLELNRRDDPLLEAAARTGGKSPFSLKKILVPIDFSVCSKKALQYALPLAKEHQAALTLLHVIAPAYQMGGEYAGIDYAALQAGIKTGCERELAELAASEVPDEVPATTVVQVGAPSHEIVAAARKLGADLIVIATHGRTGLKHVFLGSVVEHVVQRAPCPVLVVREREREFIEA